MCTISIVRRSHIISFAVHGVLAPQHVRQAVPVCSMLLCRGAACCVYFLRMGSRIMDTSTAILTNSIVKQLLRLLQVRHTCIASAVLNLCMCGIPACKAQQSALVTSCEARSCCLEQSGADVAGPIPCWKTVCISVAHNNSVSLCLVSRFLVGLQERRSAAAVTHPDCRCLCVCCCRYMLPARGGWPCVLACGL
jgi:hypothetical protein